MSAIDLRSTFLHLGLGAKVIPQPPFSGIDWYQGYGERHGGDGHEGRLVSLHTFDAPWDSWEMHPNGDELVVCLAGRITLHQELADGTKRTVHLEPYHAVINPPGAWHTADVTAAATALFITSGIGTQHRPR